MFINLTVRSVQTVNVLSISTDAMMVFIGEGEASFALMLEDY